MQEIMLLDEESDQLQYDLPEFGKRKVKQTNSVMSTSSIDSGVGLSLKTSHSSVSSLIGDVDTSGCTIPEVPWEVVRADLVIKVGNTLFPVHRSLVSLHSDILKNIIFSLNFSDEDTPVITIMELSASRIMHLLTHSYFPDKKVNDDNVLQLLSIADEFVAEKLTRKCEGYLMTKSKKTPFELLKIACKYRLKNLIEMSLVEASRLPRLLQKMDKENLGLEIENRILRLMLERYESSHQCADHPENQVDCCFSRTRKLFSKYNSAGAESDTSDDDSQCDYDDIDVWKTS
ncbi:uncharacterized protein LOC135681204 [Rhopilema esculentum]|uniref:uncharacterized protein LOC135681204 n=1 Tax=Rhopilema esculentum TaxID=499914 RepID=UPI0031DDD353